MKKTLLLFFLICLTSNVSASPKDAERLFGLTPGKQPPFAIEPFAPGTPFAIFRLPTQSQNLKRIFFDLEFMVSNQSKRIGGLGAKRAYQGKLECESAQREVRDLLAKAFPNKYLESDPRWQFISEDGAITAGAYCSISSGTPYPVLEMDVTHTETNDEILKHFKRVPARSSTK
jgi:hypothetical protein